MRDESLNHGIRKAPTGINGLDEITRGGLPAQRGTLLCGGPGCGKTVIGMEFLVRGASQHGEPGLFVAFEESTNDLKENFSSFGLDIADLCEKKLLGILEVRVSRDELTETGDFSLDGLLIRLETAINAIGAKRVVLDSLQSLYTHIAGDDILRRETARLFRWLKSKGITSIVTAEHGNKRLTRYGFEEYVSDCVLVVDHRVQGSISKRRLRIVKYRGSAHGVDEYPFLIGDTGVSVFPITSAMTSDFSGTERVSSGIRDLDTLLGHGGYYRGSRIPITGTAGTGKSTFAAAFANSVCEQGQRCVYFAFEEPQSQILRNMRSVGIDLGRHVAENRLLVRSTRASFYGLEEHLVALLESTHEHKPHAVIMDPITSFMTVGLQDEVRSMLTRLFEYFKREGTTLLLTSLTNNSDRTEATDTQVSSIMDTWLVLQHRFQHSERLRWLYIAKSRGMAHSLHKHQVQLTSSGVALSRDSYQKASNHEVDEDHEG